MSNKYFQIAAILTARDYMSSTVASAVNKSMESFEKMNKVNIAMRDGFLMMGAGKKGLEYLGQTTDAYGEMETAGNKLKAAMMQKGGVYDETTYKKIESMSLGLSDKYANTAAAYLDMSRVMINNRINPNDILGGIGESASKLADIFGQMNPTVVGEFAARLRNDMGVSSNEMVKMMDLTQKLHSIGIGKDGEEAVMHMNEFFSKVGLGMANLHSTGLKEAQSLGVLGAMFMTKGITGQTVGTNFRRILDGLRDPERLYKSQAIASQYGKHLSFFDSNHEFHIDNMVQQLSKLQGLKPDAIAQILKPFSGRQGLSTDFLEYLANDGLRVFAEYNKKVEEQASLDEKLSVIMGGLNYKQQTANTSWTNTKAILGEALSPILKVVYEDLNKIAIVTRDFTNEHPKLAKTMMLMAGFGSIGLLVGGAAVSLKAAAAGMQLLGISTTATMATMSKFLGPVAIAAAVFSYWDEKIITLNGHAYTLGESLWQLVKPLEKILALASYPVQAWDWLWGATPVKGGKSYDPEFLKLNANNNYFLRDIDNTDKWFANRRIANAATSSTMNFTSNITVNGNTDKGVATNIIEEQKRMFEREMKNWVAEQNRKSVK